MSTLPPPAPPDPATPEESPRAKPDAFWKRLLVGLWQSGRSLVLVALVYSVAAVLAAVVWHALAVPAVMTKSGTGVQMNEAELGRIFATDGWFILISAGFGLVLGLGVELLRRGNPLTRVIAVGAAGLLAAWVMSRVGAWLGPPDPHRVFPGAADGATIPMQLHVRAHADYLVWAFASLSGALLVLLLRPRDVPEQGDIRFPAQMEEQHDQG